MKKSVGLHPLPFPVPVWVVGTYDEENKPDMMTAAWAGVACSDPPCVSVSVRPSRKTYSNIISREAFTVNVPPAEYVKEVDYFGLVSGRDQNKPDVTGLAVSRSGLVDAPILEGFPLVIECELIRRIEIGSHTEFIGEILDIKLEETMIGADGELNAGELDFFVLFGGYRKVGEWLGESFSIGMDIKG